MLGPDGWDSSTPAHEGVPSSPDVRFLGVRTRRPIPASPKTNVSSSVSPDPRYPLQGGV